MSVRTVNTLNYYYIIFIALLYFLVVKVYVAHFHIHNDPYFYSTLYMQRAETFSSCSGYFVCIVLLLLSTLLLHIFLSNLISIPHALLQFVCFFTKMNAITISDHMHRIVSYVHYILRTTAQYNTIKKRPHK